MHRSRRIGADEVAGDQGIVAGVIDSDPRPIARDHVADDLGVRRADAPVHVAEGDADSIAQGRGAGRIDPNVIARDDVVVGVVVVNRDARALTAIDHIAFEDVGNAIEIGANAVTGRALHKPDIIALLAQRGGSGAVGADEVSGQHVSSDARSLNADAAAVA